MLTVAALFAAGLALMAVSVGYLYRRECGLAVTFSPILLFCLNELVFVWPAVIYARAQGISEDCYAAAVTLTCTFAFIGGYVLTRGRGDWGRGAPLQFCRQPILPGPGHAHLLAVFACSLVFMSLGYYLFRGTPPAVSGLLEFFRHGYLSGINEILSEQRLELTKGHYFGGEYRGQGAVRYVLRVGWPFLTVIAFVRYFAGKKSLWKGVSLAGLFACFVYIGGDGTRGPFLWSLVSVLVAVSYCVRLRMRSLVGFGAVLILLLVTISLPQKLSKVEAAGEHWSKGVEQLSERIFFGNGVNSVYVIEFLRTGYLAQQNGAIHVKDLGAALPFVDGGVPFTYELFLLQNPNAKASRTTLSSMTYLGRAYGDFGWGGAAILYAALGALTARIGSWLYRGARTPTGVAFVGLMAMSIGQMNLNGVVYSLVTSGVLVVVAKLYEFALALTPQKRVRRKAPRRPLPRHVYRTTA